MRAARFQRPIQLLRGPIGRVRRSVRLQQLSERAAIYAATRRGAKASPPTNEQERLACERALLEGRAKVVEALRHARERGAAEEIESSLSEVHPHDAREITELATEPDQRGRVRAALQALKTVSELAEGSESGEEDWQQLDQRRRIALARVELAQAYRGAVHAGPDDETAALLGALGQDERGAVTALANASGSDVTVLRRLHAELGKGVLDDRLERLVDWLDSWQDDGWWESAPGVWRAPPAARWTVTTLGALAGVGAGLWFAGVLWASIAPIGGIGTPPWTLQLITCPVGGGLGGMFVAAESRIGWRPDRDGGWTDKEAVLLALGAVALYGLAVFVTGLAIGLFSLLGRTGAHLLRSGQVPHHGEDVQRLAGVGALTFVAAAVAMVDWAWWWSRR